MMSPASRDSTSQKIDYSTPQSSPQSLDLNGITVDFSSNRPGFGLLHQVLPLEQKKMFFSSDPHRETLS